MGDRNALDVSAARAGYNALAGMAEWASYWQLRNRTLLLFGDIGGRVGKASRDDDEIELEIRTRDGMSDLIAALMYLDSVSNEPIRLLINSPGGDIMAGMALVQTMRDMRSDVHTFVMGMAASMAAVVAVAGSRRFAYPAARWLLHRGKGGAKGDYEDIAIAAKELRIVDSYADQVILNSTGGRITPKGLKRLQRKDFWLGTQEALKWGVVDEIVQPRQVQWEWTPKDVPPEPKEDEEGAPE